VTFEVRGCILTDMAYKRRSSKRSSSRRKVGSSRARQLAKFGVSPRDRAKVEREIESGGRGKPARKVPRRYKYTKAELARLVDRNQKVFDREVEAGRRKPTSSAAITVSKTGKQWKKTPAGKWVQVGAGKSANARQMKKPARKGSKAKKPWPKKRSKQMSQAVAGVEARVHEDLLKAHKLVQAARYRIKNTSKASGGRVTGESIFKQIVKGIEALLESDVAQRL